jgi:hypothetical protein
MIKVTNPGEVTEPGALDFDHGAQPAAPLV